MPGEAAADPYAVWLSEVMLQQTTVAAVIPYFHTFMQRWPDLASLASATDAEIMAAWAGLGYYRRARNLIDCARKLAARGSFPATEAELRTLPGLGPYIAAAIAAIAFDEPAVVVDANVERVVARLFCVEEPLPRARKQIYEHAKSITPALRPGDYAQAMMDLGATICTSRNPQCALCPLRGLCQAGDDPARLPVKPVRKARPERTGTCYWFEQDGAVWLVRRAGRGMLAGMRALPDDGWGVGQNGHGIAPFPGNALMNKPEIWQDMGNVHHVFSHFSLKLSVLYYTGKALSLPADASGEWWPIAQIEDAGLPSVFAKAARRVLAERESE